MRAMRRAASRARRHPSLMPSQLYRTQDGRIFLMCNKEKFWPILCDAVGRPEWRRSRFRSFKDRLANREP